MTDWETRVARFWDTAGELTPERALAGMDELLASRPGDDPAALYERASVLDFLGREAEAEPYYRRALAGGLDGGRRPQAVIQLASTLRNLGRSGEAVELLRVEEDDDYRDARTAFLALALIDAGRPAEAAARALRALAGHLPYYRRAVAAYADEVLERDR